jgi:GT2 family glycosyltransferase
VTKIIVMIPVYNCAGILPQLFNSLYALSPQPDFYVFAENNSSDDTLSRIQEFRCPHKTIRVWFRKDAALLHEGRYEPIAQIRQLLLTFARNIDPEYAVFLDSDVFPRTPELLRNLTCWQKDIVGGAYLRAYPDGIWLASKWRIPGDDRVLRLYSVRKVLDKPLVTSAGCLCLSRKIIQDRRIDFVPLIPGASEDFGYCLKARELGYKVFLDGISKLYHHIPERLPLKPWSRNALNEYELFFY